jgi:hypothetical protein
LLDFSCTQSRSAMALRVPSQTNGQAKKQYFVNEATPHHHHKLLFSFFFDLEQSRYKLVGCLMYPSLKQIKTHDIQRCFRRVWDNENSLCPKARCLPLDVYFIALEPCLEKYILLRMVDSQTLRRGALGWVIFVHFTEKCTKPLRV